LVGAEGGLWDLGGHEIIREENLIGGKFLDAWILEKLPPKATTATGGTALESIYAIPPYLIYLKGRTIEIKLASEALSTFTLSPPTNKKSWMRFNSQVAPYQHGRDPFNLGTWMSAFHGQTSELKDVDVIDPPRVQGKNFSLVFRSIRPMDPTVQFPGLSLREVRADGTMTIPSSVQPGVYVLNYNSTEGWTIQKATPPRLSAKMSWVGNVKSLRSDQVTVDVKNFGSSAWYGTISVEADKQILGAETGWINASSKKVFQVTWSPLAAGKEVVSIDSNKHVLDARDISVTSIPRGNFEKLWPLSVPFGGITNEIVDGLFGLFIVGGSLWVWRRLTVI